MRNQEVGVIFKPQKTEIWGRGVSEQKKINCGKKVLVEEEFWSKTWRPMFYDINIMPAMVWNGSIPVCVSVKAWVCKHMFSICVGILFNRSVSAGCASTAQQFTNPHSAPDCPFWQFSVEAPCSPPLLLPALVSLLYSFCPTVDEDIAIGCLSSLWQWSALMDIPVLEDTQMVDGLTLYIESLRGTCWSYFCCRQVVLSGNLTSPFLSVFTLFAR